jgi:DNA-binding MarR family transcriptional regulator
MGSRRLEAEGYVRRDWDEDDARRVRIYVTKKANAIRDKALVARQNLVCSLGQTEEEVQQLKRLVDRLLLALRSPEPKASDPTSRFVTN